MKNLLRWACAIACVLLPSLASAQSTGSSVIFPSGWAPGQSVCTKQVDGSCVPVSAANPFPVTGGGGGGATGPTRATSTTTPGSVTTANTYQSALASNTSRNGCTIQNTSTSTMRIYVGAVGSATDAGAFQIAAGGSFSCASPGGIVITDAISVASSTATSSYVVVSQ
jgi:hypothetical protein